MGIINKTIKVIPHGKSTKHYREKGYDVKNGQELEVKIEDLMMSSAVLVDTVCDYCGKRREPIRYVAYNAQTKNGTEKCCCVDCAKFKREESMIKKYGNKNPMAIPELMNKRNETNLKKYGFKSPSSNPEIRKKQKETLMENYGVENPSLSKELQEKRKQTFIERFGVENPLLNKEIKDKAIKTIIERYGVENVSRNKDIQHKKEQTFIERYGVTSPLKNIKFLEKMKQTNLERYGYEFVLQSDETKQKIKKTNLERYGYESCMQSPDFLEKWLARNGSNFVKHSRQQQYLCGLYGGILNHPFKCFALDIYLPDEKIDIEFDGSGHRMSIALGSISKENFDMRELYRNIAIKNADIKQIRIVSTKDKLPQDETLLQMLEHSKEYFSNYPNHSWIEFNIDASTVRNAEQKDGVFFDYGNLRTIKESDLTNQESA
jgi:hypothetical protein